MNINDVCESATIFPRPCKLTFDLESGVRVSVTWATYVSILVFLSLSALELFPMYVTDRRQTETYVRQHHCLMPHLGAGA